MSRVRWIQAGLLLTLDVTKNLENLLWLDRCGVLALQDELRAVWREGDPFEGSEHLHARLLRLLADAQPDGLFSATSHWVTHVFKHGGSDRSGEFDWATALKLLADEAPRSSWPWGGRIEAVHQEYCRQFDQVEAVLDKAEAAVPSEWDQWALRNDENSREAALTKISLICSANAFVSVWEQECADLSANDIDEMSDWVRLHGATLLGQSRFHVPDAGVWRHDLRRYLVDPVPRE